MPGGQSLFTGRPPVKISITTKAQNETTNCMLIKFFHICILNCLILLLKLKLTKTSTKYNFFNIQQEFHGAFKSILRNAKNNTDSI